MELVHGKSSRVVGDLVTLLVLCKGLPQAYNRDLQEDKEPLFDSVKTIIGMLEVSTKFAQNITFNRERIQRALPAGHLDATTVADYLNPSKCFRRVHKNQLATLQPAGGKLLDGGLGTCICSNSGSDLPYALPRMRPKAAFRL
ncbi:hypothetical protein C5167_030575 [Papaver somniferum]|nr:hypothetical protein C5167_030575 [Papaver somniferum]